MKGLKKGSISLSVSGMVSVMASDYPEIGVNDANVASYIADTMGLDKKELEKIQFPGKVTLIVENFGTDAKIENTMTADGTQDGADQGGVVDAV